MRHHKRIILLIVVLLAGTALLLPLIQRKRSAVTDDAAAVPVLNVYFPDPLGNVSDAELVSRELSDYVEPLIGARVSLHFLPSYEKSISEILSSGNTADVVYCPDRRTMKQWTENNWLCPLNELLESHGQGITDAVSSDYFPWDGEGEALYALPTNRDRASSFGIEYNAQIAEDYGLDLSGVRELSDLEPVFAELKEKAPQIVPFVLDEVYLKYWDKVGGGYGVLCSPADETKLSNEYETEGFRKLVLLLRSWNKKGYLMDQAQEPGKLPYYMRSGQVFCSVAQGKPGIETQESRYNGCPTHFLELFPALLTNDSLELALYSIPVSASDYERSMDLLRLMYTDPVVANLIVNGIEGVHYVVKEKETHVIGYPEGMDINTSPYSGFMGWAYCNQYLTDLWEGEDIDIWNELETFNRTAAVSTAFGFSFRPAPVADLIEACDAVVEQYLPGFFAGIYEETELTLAVFQYKLRKAGINEIIREKQSQFDAWLEAGE